MVEGHRENYCIKGFCSAKDSSEIDLCAGCEDCKYSKKMANEGFSSWLKALPKEDWSKEYERATTIRWDPDKGWIEEL